MRSDTPQVWDRANGYMVWLRLILPALMSVGLFQLNTLNSELKEVKRELAQEIRLLRTTIDSDVRSDLSEVKERLASLEKQASIDTRRIDDFRGRMK